MSAGIVLLSGMLGGAVWKWLQPDPRINRVMRLTEGSRAEIETKIGGIDALLTELDEGDGARARLGARFVEG